MTAKRRTKGEVLQGVGAAEIATLAAASAAVHVVAMARKIGVTPLPVEPGREPRYSREDAKKIIAAFQVKRGRTNAMEIVLRAKRNATAIRAKLIRGRT